MVCTREGVFTCDAPGIYLREKDEDVTTMLHQAQAAKFPIAVVLPRPFVDGMKGGFEDYYHTVGEGWGR